jgi:uncharacterized membrane protein YfcA
MAIGTTGIPNTGRLLAAALIGLSVGVLGGLIGLGGAEFRLPLLISVLGFPALEAVIVNKATSLIVVASGLYWRTQAVPLDDVLAQWPVMLTLLSGSLVGAWAGASWATQLGAGLYRVIAAALVLIALVLLLAHDPQHASGIVDPWLRTTVGIVAGLVIGAVASLLGVAGGELLIPTLVLLFGLDLKLAGSVSLAVSLPTMVVGFARYSQDRAFTVLGRHRSLVIAMAIGSLLGVALGGLLVNVVPTAVLLPMLATILAISAIKVWRHR